MRKIITTALATMVALGGYSQTYLPLTGGTLTGPLSGTISTFTGRVYVNSVGSASFVLNSAGSYYGVIQNDSENKWSLGFSPDGALGTSVLSWTPTSVALSKPLTGTSATFSGMGRFSGWYSSGSGHSAEVGVYGGMGYLMSYDRTLNQYQPVGVAGSSISLIANGGEISMNSKLTGTSATFNKDGAAADIASSPFNFGGNTYYSSQLSLHDASNRTLILRSPNSIEEAKVGTTTGHSLELIQGNVARLTISGSTISSSLPLNIGTTQAGANLYVYGTVKTKEVKVESTITVPDYVFEKSYELKPLAEVEKYVSENKHLPEIPSAKEIGKDGINLGEMQMKLLQKIEELTLHLIEQDKKNAAQQKEIEELKAELHR